LEALLRLGSPTLNELAAELYLDQSTTSRVVDALERKGYVRRARHPEDGRAIALRVTAAGARLFSRVEREILGEERALLAEIDPEVRASLVRLMSRLVEVASSKLDTSGGRCCTVR
jgi:DNA-binding MarR family transcriptional regulator